MACLISVSDSHHLRSLPPHTMPQPSPPPPLPPQVTVTTVGFVRVMLFGTDLGEAIAIAVSLYVVVITSIIIGAALPLLLNAASIDPAHASTTIQVIMDISGVLIVCVVSAIVLESGLLPQWLLESDLNWRSDSVGNEHLQVCSRNQIQISTIPTKL